MAKTINKLTDRKVSALNKAGLYGDGAGLWLKVTPTKSKSWIFRYTRNKKTVDFGLGSVNDRSLADARLEAEKKRNILLLGGDPLELKKSEANSQKIAKAVAMTFKQCAEAYINKQQHEFKNAKHLQQWRNTLERYCFPIIGGLPVADIAPP